MRVLSKNLSQILDRPNTPVLLKAKTSALGGSKARPPAITTIRLYCNVFLCVYIYLVFYYATTTDQSAGTSHPTSHPTRCYEKMLSLYIESCWLVSRVRFLKIIMLCGTKLP